MFGCALGFLGRLCHERQQIRHVSQGPRVLSVVVHAVLNLPALRYEPRPSVHRIVLELTDVLAAVQESVARDIEHGQLNDDSNQWAHTFRVRAFCQSGMSPRNICRLIVS